MYKTEITLKIGIMTDENPMTELSILAHIAKYAADLRRSTEELFDDRIDGCVDFDNGFNIFSVIHFGENETKTNGDKE